MPIACALFENNITSDPDDYAAMLHTAAVPTATTWSRTSSTMARW